jgi:hypothetical protein
MAASQDWSDWAGAWFDGTGKILQIIAIAALHL